ncbi:MAG: hypothetical protein ACLTMP_02740 [Eggerthella lenta]
MRPISMPDNAETVRATAQLVEEGFVVLPYMFPDPSARATWYARRGGRHARWRRPSGRTRGWPPATSSRSSSTRWTCPSSWTRASAGPPRRARPWSWARPRSWRTPRWPRRATSPSWRPRSNAPWRRGARDTEPAWGACSTAPRPRRPHRVPRGLGGP